MILPEFRAVVSTEARRLKVVGAVYLTLIHASERCLELTNTMNYRNI